MSLREPWRKILYAKQDYPDNYVDESFLKDLQKNLHVKYYSIFDAVTACSVVTLEICSVAIFGLTFIYMDTGHLKTKDVFLGSTSITLMVYFLCLLTQNQSWRNIESVIFEDVRSTSIFFLFGYCLSPILKTLTHTISTDTIYTMSISMMILHLICQDYGVPGAFVSPSVSFNSSLFSTVCLASRLGTVEDAFVLLTLSLELFTLFPLLRTRLKRFRVTWIVVTFAIFFTTLYGVLTFSVAATMLFVLIIVFVNVICPVWFVKWQSYKENLYGPWDEAVIEKS